LNLMILFGVPFLILISLIYWNGILGTEVQFKPPTVYVSLGNNFFLFPLFFLTYILIAFFNLIRKFKKGEKLEKKQLKFFFIFTSLAVLFGVIFNIFLYWIWEIGYATHFGPLGTVIMIVGLTYSISTYRLFNIRVIATELLVGIVAVILLIDLLTSKSLSTILLKGGILIAFGYIGILLLQSVYREIERREEIERIDRAKSEFISIASHQLRTPLTAVKGYISMVLEGIYGKLSQKQERPLKNVFRSNERLIKLVNDLLNLSRLDAGKIDFSPEPTSLEEMADGIVEELKINAENRGLYMKMTKPKKPLPKIMVDKDKLRQVILNIVDNAIKYTKTGGITIELRKLDSEEQIRISDTGEGMTKHEIDSLFQMFSRATAGTQLHTEGAGLGLYVARQFIEMHGGDIKVESSGKGKGSTFILKLPIHVDPKILQEKLKKITKSNKISL